MNTKDVQKKEFTPTIGVGVGDLQLAASREMKRIMREADSDLQKAVKLVLEKIHQFGWITESELKSLSKVSEIGFDSAKGNGQPERAYVEVRRIYDEMLAGGQASPTALAITSAAAGSYLAVEDVDGQPTVIFKKAGNWQGTLTGAGAIIGGALDGERGAALGAAIGGVVGKVVDECLE